MTEGEKIQVLVRSRLEQATEAMAAAELNLDFMVGVRQYLDANPPRRT